ncbi:uncharacterized protein [Miscanthus floridulus]|uniref:uncharacterized protein n=1 Tax=Miscanthus floridulus TaxID=154761 RepID=UPI003458330A
MVVEEEEPTREVKRLRSTLSTAMKQIEQLIKRMDSLSEENKKLKEVVKLMEKNVWKAQHERDLAKSNAKDLEYQKGILSEQMKTVFEQLERTFEQLKTISSSWEQDAELDQLHQVIGQLQEEKEKASRRAEKLAEDLEEYRQRTKA